jgi:CRP-like cAMP-binding protein
MAGKNDILDFIRRQPTKRFLKGETILRQGEEPEVLYGVRSGFIKAYDIASDGSEQLIWLAKRADVVPLEWLFAQDKTTPYFYAAFTDVEVYLIDKGALLENLKDNNEAMMMVVEAITGKYAHVMSHLNAAQKPRARDKIMYLLQFIAARFSHNEGGGVDKVEVPLTHQDFANLVGLARETTTLELKKLKEQGLVDYDKNHFYIRSEKLADAME